MNKDVIIKPSLIPNAGLGVFALRNIKKGKILGYYKGKILTEDQYLKLKNKEYIFEINLKNQPNIYIDAKSKKLSNWTRYVNGAKTKKQKKMINIKPIQRGYNIYYTTLRDIKKGEELIMDYGEFYWD